MISSIPLQPPQPSSALLHRAQAGEDEALRALLEPFRDPLFRLAFRLTGHAEDAEDLLQEAFLRMIRSLPSYRNDCRFQTWAYRITLNVCLSARRKRRESTMASESMALTDSAPGPEHHAMQTALQERIREEIRRMPSIYREAVALRVMDELSYAEIAEVLGLPFDTARMRIYRGMERLRARLRPWLDEEAPHEK